MEEDDIKKTAFRGGSSGLYKFTCIPFGLSNAGSNFCWLMEQCLGDQQFVTFLLYLDDICIFALSIEVMLDWFELVFNRLKEYHLKIKPKKCHFLTPMFCFWAMFYQPKEYQLTLTRWKRCGIGQPPQMQRKYIPSQVLLPIIGGLFQNLSRWPIVCMEWLVQPQNQEKTVALTILTEEEVFNWMSQHQQAFDVLKEALVRAPVLGYPDFSREFMLETDALCKV